MKRKQAIRILSAVLIFAVFILAGNFLAPLAAKSNTLNPYCLLNWGAPAVFYEDFDEDLAAFKLEPWRLLGMQLPAFASVGPEDWQASLTPAPVRPVTPQPQPERPGQILIYHSHTSEAFVPTCGSAWSQDPGQTVARLGQVIVGTLTANGIAATQSSRSHDQPYNKSYAESRKTAKELLAAAPATLALIDIHRDGFGKTAEVGRKATTAAINGKLAGQIMIVLSSAHPNWQDNSRVANDLHNLMEDKYPGLSRGILVRLNSTFNQDLHPGAILIEIGGHWNSLEEAIYGAELFADILVDYCGGAR